MNNKEFGLKKEMTILLWIFVSMMTGSIILALLLTYFFK
jgi:hypothetical protein